MGIKKHETKTNFWYVDAHVRLNGRTIRKRKLFEGTKREAKDFRTALAKELRTGLGDSSARSISYFGEALDLYDQRNPVPPRRRGQYNQLQSDLGGVPLNRLADSLEDYLKLLKTRPSPAIGKPISEASTNRLMQMLMAALNLAVKLEVLDKNPISRNRFPKYKEVPRDRVLTEDELSRLQKVIKEEAPHLEPIVEFSIWIPSRKSELVNMKRPQLDLKGDGCIRIPNGTTKNKRGMWKPIPPAMKAYFETLPPEDVCPYLFHRYEKKTDQFFPLGDFKKAWKRCLRLADIPDFRFHDLRHMAVSLLINNGTPERVVMQIAGWVTPMFSTYYHMAGKESLAFVKFEPDSGHIWDTTSEVEKKIA